MGRLTVQLPRDFLARDVILEARRVEETGAWVAVAVDRVGNSFPVLFDGKPFPRCIAPLGVSRVLGRVDLGVGDRVFAAPVRVQPAPVAAECAA